MKFLAIVLLQLAIVSSAYAADASSTIGIVDIKKIVGEALATKDVKKQVETTRDKLQAEVKKEEESLRKRDQELTAQKSVLEKEAFEKKAEAFKADVVKAQQRVQDSRAKLEEAYTNAVSEIQKSVVDIIAQAAEKRKLTLVLPKSQVLYHQPAQDISDEILAELNKRLPKVKVKVE